MSKPAFQGQNDAPAPAQGFNRHVHDTSSPKAATPKTVAKTAPIDTNDHGPKSEFARRHDARVKDAPGDKLSNQPGCVGNNN